jgi:hypothetical protein
LFSQVEQKHCGHATQNAYAILMSKLKFARITPEYYLTKGTVKMKTSEIGLRYHFLAAASMKVKVLAVSTIVVMSKVP